jgi:hypothetical protein
MKLQATKENVVKNKYRSSGVYILENPQILRRGGGNVRHCHLGKKYEKEKIKMEKYKRKRKKGKKKRKGEEKGQNECKIGKNLGKKGTIAVKRCCERRKNIFGQGWGDK